jgi:CheY-like chemotaxis protein
VNTVYDAQPVTETTGAPARRILIVDDDAAVRMVLLLAFERTDYSVSVAEDGEGALELARGEQPDLMLLDIGMPGLDGLEVCRRLKSDPATRSIKIVLLTARVQERDREIGLAAGADGYLTKPFSPRAVIAYVDEALA